MLFLCDENHSLGGLLTPQTPPGADGKEDDYFDYFYLDIKKHYSLQTVFLMLTRFAKFK